MSNKVTVTGRLLNNAVFEPRVDEVHDKVQYSALVVLDEGQAEKIEKARDQVLKETFGKKIPANLADWTVREGDDEEFENTFGQKFINAKAFKKPRVVVREGGTLRDVDEEEGLIYAGCNVAVSVSVYAYKKNPEKKMPPGCTLGLRGVMFLSHNEPLGDRVSDDEFGDLESDTDFDLD